MSNLDIFNLDPESLLTPINTGSSKDLEFYKPYPEDGKDGVYKSLIRFVPNVYDPLVSKIHKYYVYLSDPVSGNSFSVDCPSTVGKKSVLKDIFWKLKNSNSAADKELSKKFARKEDFYSIIQIIQDKNKPELEGKLMLFKYGKKLNDFIEAQLKPEYGSPSNPFDLYAGREFAVNVRKVGDWNNYDMCSFVGDPCSIKIEGIQMQKNNEDMNKITEYLNSGPKNLASFVYKDWDDETTEKVMAVIRNTIPDERVISDIVAGVATSSSTYNNYTAPIEFQNKTNSFEGEKNENTIGTNEFYKEANDTKKFNANNTEQKQEKSNGFTSLDDLYNNL